MTFLVDGKPYDSIIEALRAAHALARKRTADVGPLTDRDVECLTVRVTREDGSVIATVAPLP